MNFKTTRRHAVRELQSRPEPARGTTLPPGAVTATPARRRAPAKATTLTKTLGFFVEERWRFATACSSPPRCARTRTARSVRTSSACTTRRRACRGSSPTRTSSRRGVFSSTATCASLRVRRVRRAARPERRARTYLGRARRHQGHRPADRDVQRDRQRRASSPSGRPSGKRGFESKLFNNRMQFDVTYYTRTTQDALIAAPLAPSLGIGATTQRRTSAR